MTAKQRFSTLLARFTLNPLVRLIYWTGLRLPVTILLETTGRRTGRRRITPVSARAIGGAVWFCSEHGPRSAYVANMRAQPRVRVRLRDGWHAGTAHVLEHEDAREVAVRLGLKRWERAVYFGVLRVTGSGEPTPVRIDLED